MIAAAQYHRISVSAVAVAVVVAGAAGIVDAVAGAGYGIVGAVVGDAGAAGYQGVKVCSLHCEHMSWHSWRLSRDRCSSQRGSIGAWK